MGYHAKVYTEEQFLADIEANDLAQLKRMASTICNGYFNVHDKFFVYKVHERQLPDVCYRRLNQKSPDNVIVRVNWQ